MGAVALPANPLPWSNKPRYLDFGGDMTPPLGGAAQRPVRLGSRWACDFVMPPMRTATLAQQWVAARMAARVAGSTVIVAWPQKGGSWGAPTVQGANQAGSTLQSQSWGAALPKAGTFFSFVGGATGRNYLHVLTQDVTAVAGASLLEIAPMIRESPANNAALQFNTPQIEGFLTGTTEEWDRDRLIWDTMKFTIQEIA